MAGLRGAGNCTLCNHEKRFELEYEYIKGATQQAIADAVGVTQPAIRNHFDRGHCLVDINNLRSYLIQNTTSPVKNLEKRQASFIEKIMAQPEEVNQKMIQATLLVCANDVHELTQLMKEREDFRGSNAAYETLRRTIMDMANLLGLKSDGKEDLTIESEDVSNLRASVFAEIQRRTGDTPGEPEHNPLR